jgi:hypothetical protein
MTPENLTAAAHYASIPIPPDGQQPAAKPTVQPRRDPLRSVSSVVDEVRRHVTNLSAVPAQDLPEWLQSLDVPSGWQQARIGDGAVPVGRVVVSGHKPEGGWEGCETLTLFRFNGTPPSTIVEENAERTLRDLDADNVHSYSLAVAAGPSASAARSSGYFTADQRRIWAQYSTYMGLDDDGGFLIEHAIYVDAAQRALLRHDVEDLADAVHSVFLDRVDTVNTNDSAER